MSYILDALKKSERERALDNISTLSPVIPVPLSVDNKWPRRWIALGMLVLIGLLIWKYQAPLHQVASSYLHKAKNVVVNVSMPDPVGESARTGEAQSQAVETPVSDVSKQVTQSAAPITMEDDTAPFDVSSSVAKVEAKPVPGAEEGKSGASQPVPESPGNTALVESKQEPEVLSLNQAPEVLRQKLSGLTLAAVSYAKDAQKRFVLVNNQMYREGDALPGGIVIEEITSDGIITAYQGVRILLRP